MSYTALYRKYRPSNFKSVVGQDTTVTILKNSIINSHISHAYLFTGPRGTGKTSIAKIFAHAVNCENFVDDICNECNICKNIKDNDSDIIEIDAASNNGVEEIRTLRDNVKLLPSFCKYKIYIIDEVHMLSTGAFNALLKTLEEPPAHAIFILATTEPNKIPVTILSRCQRFDFNKIDNESLKGRLKFILDNESKYLDDTIINYIAEVSDGGLRDAINLLDQTLSLSNDNITISDIEALSGKISKDLVFKVLKAVISSDYITILDISLELNTKGKSFIDLVNNMLIVLRDYAISLKVDTYFDEEYNKLLRSLNLNSDEIVRISKILNELVTELKNSNDQKLMFEIYLMNLMQVTNNNMEEDLINSQPEIKSEVINTETVSTSQNIEEPPEVIDLVKEQEDLTIEVSKNSQTEISTNSVNLLELKKIRINNVFSGANKDILNKIVKDYDRINDYISNKVYNIIAALLIDGKVVVASDKYLLFSFNDESYISLFDSNYRLIESFMNEIYDIPFKVVAITGLEWEKYKQEFILNKKNNVPYVLIDENVVKLDVSESSNELENSAINIFGEDTVSVR